MLLWVCRWIFTNGFCHAVPTRWTWMFTFTELWFKNLNVLTFKDRILLVVVVLLLLLCLATDQLRQLLKIISFDLLVPLYLFWHDHWIIFIIINFRLHFEYHRILFYPPFDIVDSIIVFLLFRLLDSLFVNHFLKVLFWHILAIFLTWSKLIYFMVHLIDCGFLNLLNLFDKIEIPVQLVEFTCVFLRIFFSRV